MSNIPELMDKLQSARADAIYLATHLLAAAHRFNRDNLMPPATLAGHIQECRRRFEAVRAEVAEFMDPDEEQFRERAASLESIDELVSLLKEYAAKLAVNAPAPRLPVADMLERAALIRCTGEVEFAPLAACQELAVQLLEDMRAGTLYAAKLALADGFGGLIKLIEMRDQLSESEATMLRDAIGGHFGRALAAAAWNRELFLEGTSPKTKDGVEAAA